MCPAIYGLIPKKIAGRSALLLIKRAPDFTFLGVKSGAYYVKHWFSILIAVRTGLEPATPCVTGMYSNQLNYRT